MPHQNAPRGAPCPINPTTPIVAIVGPTGAGKSELAQKVAQSLEAAVLSADSMQIYQGMDIGTAKLPLEERVVPHFGIDLVAPTQSYSAADYQAYARNIIEAQTAASSGTPPVVCGGTGLYLRAALDDFDLSSLSEEQRQQQTATRQHYEELHRKLGAEELHALLNKEDPEAARQIHPNNVRRVIRAFEMRAAGDSYADVKQAFKTRTSHYSTLWIGLDCDRELLYQRINARVDAMMAAGLLDEVAALLTRGYREALTASAAIGYKELVPVLEDGADLDTAVEEIKQATRRYAKRQLTWFRGDDRVCWIDVGRDSADEITQHILQLYEQWQL